MLLNNCSKPINTMRHVVRISSDVRLAPPWQLPARGYGSIHDLLDIQLRICKFRRGCQHYSSMLCPEFSKTPKLGVPGCPSRDQNVDSLPYADR